MKSKEIANEVQKEIKKLTGERDRAVDRAVAQAAAPFDAEIRRLSNIFAACEVNGKSGAVAAQAAEPKLGARAIAMQMLGESVQVSPADLSKRAGVSGAAASAMLNKLTEEKVARRIKRGFYGLKVTSGNVKGPRSK